MRCSSRQEPAHYRETIERPTRVPVDPTLNVTGEFDGRGARGLAGDDRRHQAHHEEMGAPDGFDHLAVGRPAMAPRDCPRRPPPSAALRGSNAGPPRAAPGPISGSLPSSVAGACPAARPRDPTTVFRILVGAEKERALVIAGDPEDVIAGGRRHEQRAHPLAVVTAQSTGASEPKVLEGRLGRIRGIVGEVGSRRCPRC